ncbi:MAG: phycobilisome rod-core linker polypeptide [Cyanobacteria bacterium P01_D01_bin.14]
MTIPLLSYRPVTRNHRVASYEIAGEEQPRIYSAESVSTGQEMDELIYAAYRQLFNEQQPKNRQDRRFLESQLRNRQITVRDFMRELAISESFRRWIYDCNNNYRFVQICIQRLLGREVYNEREKLAWSVVLATKGLNGFIDDLLASDEYLDSFGESIVPYQRRRLLPQRTVGDLPFARMARYGESYRDRMVNTDLDSWQQRPNALPSIVAYLIGSLVVFVGLYGIAVIWLTSQ